MELNLAHLWSEMNNTVRAVVIVLTLQALFSLMVLVDRLIALGLDRRRSARFVREVGPLLEAGKEEEAGRLAESKANSSALARLLGATLSVFMKRRANALTLDKCSEHARRAAQRVQDAISEDLHRGMNILASTGSTAPFVGLLGTVLGILNAFKLISAEGGGGMETIGSAIGEALIVTGYGLVVAIPAVLFFNYLSGRIAKSEAMLEAAASELIDRLEVSVLGQVGSPYGRAAAEEDSSEEVFSKAVSAQVLPKVGNRETRGDMNVDHE